MVCKRSKRRPSDLRQELLDCASSTVSPKPDKHFNIRAVYFMSFQPYIRCLTLFKCFMCQRRYAYAWCYRLIETATRPAYYVHLSYPPLDKFKSAGLPGNEEPAGATDSQANDFEESTLTCFCPNLVLTAERFAMAWTVAHMHVKIQTTHLCHAKLESCLQVFICQEGVHHHRIIPQDAVVPTSSPSQAV